jgi:hypothetical protein
MRARGRVTVRAAALALVAVLVAQTGCGIAERAGRGATEGAVGALTDKVPERAGPPDLTGDAKQRAAGSLLDKLKRPDQLEDLQQIAGAVAAATVSGAAQAAAGGQATERGRPEAPGASPVEAISEQAARAFSRQILAELGPNGQGPLATSLAATTGQVTESVARGARGELAPLFPECGGADAAGCLERTVERVSRAGSAGIAAGIGAALGGWPLLLGFMGTFAVGALAALVLVWAWGLHRASASPRLRVGAHRRPRRGR